MKQWVGASSSEEVAVARGLKTLGLSREQVVVDVLGQEESSLFSLFGFRRVRVKLTERSPRPFFRERSSAQEKERSPRGTSSVPRRNGQSHRLEGPRANGLRRVTTPPRSPDKERQEISNSPRPQERQSPQTSSRPSSNTNRFINRPALLGQAEFAAKEVKRTGSPFRLDPMGSAERRIVHQALAQDPDVETVSEGEGPWRKVVVRPREKSRGT
jgi:spoIIIJ-associated protein